MTEAQSPLPRAEPPLIARARLTGWALLALCLLCLAGERLANGPGWLIGVAVGSGLLGLLAIINVALVRGLYRQLAQIPPQANDRLTEDTPTDQSM